LKKTIPEPSDIDGFIISFSQKHIIPVEMKEKFPLELKDGSKLYVIDASIPTSEFGLRFSAPYNESSYNINEMVTLDILKTDQIYPDVDSYTKSIINSKTFNEYAKLITFDDVDINGIPAKKIEYINDEYYIPLKMLNYVMLIDRNVFVFTYGEDFEIYPKFLNTIEKIVKSFQIIN
jgi:hypothetical protein